MTWTRAAQLWRQDAKAARDHGDEKRAWAYEYMARTCDQKAERRR